MEQDTTRHILKNKLSRIMKKWITREGEAIAIKKLGDQHLIESWTSLISEAKRRKQETV